ncbi:MAG: SIMPL domain-containing protein [Cyanobacteria bacterium P01_H01_bin.74]
MLFSSKNHKSTVLLACLSVALLTVSATLPLAEAKSLTKTEAAKASENIIATEGAAEIEGKPDSVSVRISINTKDDVLENARDMSNQKMTAIMTALEELTLDGKKLTALSLETSGLSVHPLYEAYKKNHIRKVIGYEVNNTVDVTAKNLPYDQLETVGGKLVDLSLNAGANHVGSLRFFLDDINSLEKQALQLAMEDARANADILAKAAGVVVTGVKSIHGSPVRTYTKKRYQHRLASGAMAMDAAKTESATTPLRSGNTMIRCTVQAKFLF